MSGSSEAIVFFRDNKVVKEMLYSEFEAVLDDVVGIPDFVADELQAVFVQIDNQLHVTGAVFFSIEFDSRGRVAGSWNIPLRHLLDHADFGPDLGAGPAKIACRSACPVAWYKQQLWDPTMEGDGTFEALTNAIARNRLGLIIDRVAPESSVFNSSSEFFSSLGIEEGSHSLPLGDTTEPSAVVSLHSSAARSIEKAFNAKLSALRHTEKLNQATQAEAFQNRLEAIEKSYGQKLQQRDTQLNELKEKLESLEKEKVAAEVQLDKKSRWFESKQQELEAQIAQGGKGYEDKLLVMKSEYADELKNKLRDQAGDYESRLSSRENELFQRATEIVDIRAELSRIREQNQELMLNGDEHLLGQMADKGIVFVAYHPGVEHLVIAPSEMSAYLEDPTAFVASRCDVSVGHYKRWLEHYHLPICRETDDDGEICGAQIEKILRPSLYLPGDSDRCKDHGGG